MQEKKTRQDLALTIITPAQERYTSLPFTINCPELVIEQATWIMGLLNASLKNVVSLIQTIVGL